MRLALIFLQYFVVNVGAGPSSVPKIENGVKGPPSVVCGIRQIRVTFDVLLPFAGNLYTKGFFHKPECRINGKEGNTTLEMVLPVDADCGIRRKRMSNPRGVMLDTTVILMFHPIFLTQTDKSYHVQCQYLEAHRTVTNSIDVSMLPPTELPQSQLQQDDDQTPVCRYEVLSGSLTGSPIKFATVGDAVYHKWSCNGKDKELYCMTVHSCTADDGQGVGQKLVDENGCTLDSFLLDELEYTDKLSAGQMSHVFKFADRPTIFFSCMIRIDVKDDPSARCPRPIEYCDQAPNATQPVKTTSRVDTEIPKGFPRPPSEKLLQKFPDPPDYVIDRPANSDSMSDNDNFDEEPTTGSSHRKTISPTANRIIRRDLTRFLADVDVTAPSVDVIDLPETEIGKPNRSRELKTAATTKKGEVCISRLSVFVSGCVLLVLSMATILLFCIVQRRISGSAKIHGITRKSRFPHPDYGLTLDR